MLMPSVKPLVHDEVEEIRDFAREIVDRFTRGV
jgi:hypothetical protein